jgi:serine/threonine protein kinase/formylglycine-generating enzyme required for sulfatase activity
MAPWSPPQQFEGYQLVSLIGRGAMGQVYLARDTLLDRSVAIKFVSSLAAHDDEARRRFLVEARAVARLQHPSVVTIHRVGEIGGHPYLVSEFVDGTGLDALKKPVPWQEALRIGHDLARGLAAAHRRGVVHRDIKPANAMLTRDGEVKLLDFGIAKLLDPGVARLLDAPAPTPPTPAGPGAAAGADATAATAAGTPQARPPDAVAAAQTGETTAGAPPSPAPEPLADLTRPGAFLGTPSYMAPEVWAGEPATFASDVYSLGALLHALCVGRPPHTAADLGALRARVTTTDAAPLASLVPDVDRSFAAVVDRCLARDAARRYESGNEVRAALERLISGAAQADVPEGNPYRGLRSFEAEHRCFYFGRDSETREILERLRAEPMVVIVGDSGAGKSSLCRAGVLSRAPGWLGRDGRRWSTTALTPGGAPATALAEALAGEVGLVAEEVRRALLDDPCELVRDLRRRLGDSRGIVVLVDQLEELVTLARRDEAAAFADALGWLTAPSPGIRLIATVRGDFLSRVASLPRLTTTISRSLYFLWPLSQERIREAIKGPASLRGVGFESEALVDALVDSTVRSGGGLPLLQFALARLWEMRDEDTRLISMASLDALGGVGGALGLHADEVLAQLSPRDRELARALLLELVTAEGTRARRPVRELAQAGSQAEAVLDALVRGRLVVARDTAEGPACEIAHEALLSGWETLAGWLARSSEALRTRHRIARAAAEWERLGRSRHALWRGLQLRDAAELRPADLAERERDFVAASRRATRAGRLARGALLLGIPLALALTYGGVALVARVDLDRRIDADLDAARQDLDQAIATRSRVAALARQALALFDRRQVDAAEARWAAVLRAQAGLDDRLDGVSQQIEPALALDGQRADVRALLAETLAERALLAEARRRPDERDELLRRLLVHDLDGRRRRALFATASLGLALAPGQRVDSLELERYVADGSGRRRAEPVREGAALRKAGITLAPGSYRLTIRGAGTAEVVVALTLGRGERVTLAPRLPAARDVPEGFAVVPEGWFLFGSQVDDRLRRDFYHAVPLHRVRTGAYLIARRETTFAEWIEFLDSLPPEARSARAPSLPGGTLRLERPLGGAWRISFQPTTHRLEADAGETVSYPGRASGSVQDWLRFPVSGISMGDAEAYVAWLRRSGGRVPGARLCTELEWERAARGGDDRVYPHGDALEPGDADFDATYGQDPPAMGPDEVGSHPASRSPYGLDDMVGNVWEWTTSSLAPGGPVARGGSFYHDASSARIENRETPEPAFRDVTVGLRVCADLPPR